MSDDPFEPALVQRVAEPRRVPALSLLLGYGAMLPLAACALAAWLAGGDVGRIAAMLGALWGGVILAFLAGVRRGLSLRTVRGPTVAQIATMLWLFLLALLALGLLLLSRMAAAFVLLLAGYASVGLLDPWAARRGEAPLFFEHLRPAQMLVPVASPAALLARSLAGF